MSNEPQAASTKQRVASVLAALENAITDEVDEQTYETWRAELAALPSDDDARRWLYDVYRQLLERAPALERPFRGAFGVSGSKTLTGPRALPRMDGRGGGEPVTRFAKVLCSRLVATEGTMPLVFQLTVHAGQADAEAVSVRPGKVVVRLLAAPFVIAGDAAQVIDVPADADSTMAVFTLVAPAEPGDYKLVLVIEQDGSPGSSVTVGVTVEGHTTSPGADLTTRVSLAPGAIDAPCHILYVHSYSDGNQPYLHITWLDHGQPIGVDDTRVRGNAQQIAAELYQACLALTDGLDPGAAAAGNTVALEAHEVTAQLSRIGRGLWGYLPRALQQYLWKKRQDHLGSTLMICTDEPWIPWELVVPGPQPGDPGEADGPWCTSYDLARWYRTSGQDRIDWRPHLPLSKLVLVRPADNGLAHAAAEEADLVKLIGAQHIVRPADLAPADVNKILGDTALEWVHVISHAYERGALVLDDGRTLAPGGLSDAAVRSIATGRPGVVFNACDTATRTFNLTDVGGWADKLLRSGAGLFLGTMWPVKDDTARALCVAFYQGLLDGKPVGRALRDARRDAKADGSTTWLAYTLYAHPGAVVSRP